mgnify:FL=1
MNNVTNLPNDSSSPTPPTSVPDCQPKADSGVRCSAWLGDTVEVPYELDNVDSDIREYYLADYYRRYVPGMPIKIQIARLLKQLINRNQSSDDCKSP